MGLPDFSTKKPVTTVMIFCGVLLFGLISLSKLPQELFPPIKYPQLTVFTGYANAAPEEVETLLTRPIEEAVGTVSGLKAIKSISKEGVSLVIAEFDWDQNMDFASLRTREKVDLVKARLPRDATEPLVVPFNPFELPIMTISVTGDRSPLKLRQIATNIVKEELEKIDGVASASVEGGLEREIVVEVNQSKLQTYDVSVLNVSDAITNANLNYPAGTIKESFYEYLIRTLGEFQDVKEIEEVVVKSHTDEQDRDAMMPYEVKSHKRTISEESNLVLIRDVAEVNDVFKERSSYSRYNGDENVSLSIQKQAQANTMQVINRIMGSFGRVQKLLPGDVKLEVIYDQSIYIRDAINGVFEAGVQGMCLAFLVLYVFLRNIKASFIVTLSVPISVFIVFNFMHFGHLSINMMSLGGLSLGVGMLVDNAIVVIENIFRHREMGKPPMEAAVSGTEEVSNAIVASTLTTIAVFLPMVFVVGVAGQLFKELSFTVTFSLIGSLWVALTLIPLLSCKLGGNEREAKKTAQAFVGGKVWKKVLEKYEKLLRRFLKRKGIGLFIVFLIFLSSLLLVQYLEKELMPKTDQGQFIVKIDMPTGTKLTETNKVVYKIEEYLSQQEIVDSVSSIVGSTKGSSAKDVVSRLGSHQGMIIVNLAEKREVKTVDFVQETKQVFLKDKSMQEVKIEFNLQSGVLSGAFGGGGKPITIEIKGEKLEVMEEIVKKIELNLEKIDGIFGIEDDVPEASPEIRINIDKEKASLYNISVVDLARMAQMVLRGFIPSRFKEKGQEIDIRVRLREEDRDQYSKLYRIRFNSPNGGMVPLGTVADFEKGKGPSEIKRLGQERTIMIAADIVGQKKTDVIISVEKMIEKMRFASGYRAKLAGESEEMKKSFNSLRFALILSIVIVYMIMAAQFESLTQPLIILFTVPLSLIGVMVALFVTNTSISVVALLGVIMLGGIVVNNGIVLIDYTNILMADGKKVLDAVIEASIARLRPIIMTALTTVLGLFPMALAMGRGAELRAPMAISVMGGLLASTFLTLVVIPSIFMLEHEIRTNISGFIKKRKM